MKDKRNKNIKILALKLTKLEKEIQLGKNVQENEQKIQNIMLNLSIEDMLLIDNYINKKKFLTK